MSHVGTITDEIRASASEIYQGKEICGAKSKEFLEEMGLPNGLLPLEEIEECGFVKETGFMWLKQKEKTEHLFPKLGKLGRYDTEITGFFEPKKMKKVTGIKARELFLWIAVSELSVDDPTIGKLTFKTPFGLSRTYPASAFTVAHHDEDPENNIQEI